MPGHAPRHMDIKGGQHVSHTPSLQTVKERVISFRKTTNIDLDHLSHTIGDLPVMASIDQHNAAFTYVLDEFAILKKHVFLKRSSP